ICTLPTLLSTISCTGECLLEAIFTAQRNRYRSRSATLMQSTDVQFPLTSNHVRPPLILLNRTRSHFRGFAHTVEFHSVNTCEEELPPGTEQFIREFRIHGPYIPTRMFACVKRRRNMCTKLTSVL
ncbi:hypothetical protein M514_08766, partial [Trichuris suis]